MRAAWYERRGPAHEVLVVGEMPLPVPGDGEVRIRLAFSGINPGDVKKRSGWQGSPMPYPRVVLLSLASPAPWPRAPGQTAWT